MFKLLADLIRIQRPQMELQTAGEDSHRQLLRIGSRKQKFHMRRRLFQRFQQRVEAVAREHVHFINQINFKAATGGRVLDVIQQVAGIFHFGARGGVDFNQIDKTPLLDFTAVVAHAARRGGDAGFTVQPLRQKTGDRSLADAARTGKQIGVVNSAQR